MSYQETTSEKILKKYIGILIYKSSGKKNKKIFYRTKISKKEYKK